MDELNKTTPDNGGARGTAPTLSERMRLVHAYQQQAMARPDPLTANLGVIAGDLMNVAHALAVLVQTQLSQGAVSDESRSRLVANMELYLKVVRQSDRLAQIERQLGTASPGSSQAL